MSRLPNINFLPPPRSRPPDHLPAPRCRRPDRIPVTRRYGLLFPAFRVSAIFPIFPIFSVLILALTGCAGKGDPAIIQASGHIEMTEVRLATKVGGRLLSFPPREGDRINTGQQIAQIDTVDLVWQRNAIKSEAEQAAAELRLLLAGSRADEIAETEALMHRAQAELESAEKDFVRMDGLLQGGTGSVKDRDDAKNRRDQAAANVEAVGQQLHRRKAGSRPEEIEAARAGLGSVQARLALAEQLLRDAVVVSLPAGVVTERLAEPGELLSAGTPLCVVADMAHPWLTIYVGEPDLGCLHLGQEAEVTTDAGQKRIGRITYISDKAEFTPKNVQTSEERVKLVYKVKISLANDDEIFKSGMPAEARIKRQKGTSSAPSGG